MYPLTQQAAALKRKPISIDGSLAGKCYVSGKPIVNANTRKDPAHYDKADTVSGFRTQDMVSFPLRTGSTTVGVLQLLNRQGPTPFLESDLPYIEALTVALATKLASLTASPESLEVLGITPEKEPEAITVMFCDLTRSSLLFQALTPSSATQHLNEYFERVCGVAIGPEPQSTATLVTASCSDLASRGQPEIIGCEPSTPPSRCEMRSQNSAWIGQ
jgi:hypothetical protein